MPFAQISKRARHVFRCTSRVPYLGATLLLLAGCMPLGVHGQLMRRVDSVTAAVDVSRGRPYPDLGTRREITLSGVGAGLLAAHYLVPAAGGAIPREGLDPIEIAWSLDREIVGNHSLSADRASNWTADAAVALPLLLGWATMPHSERWRGFGRRTLIYAETFLLSQGITRLAKTTLGRARPYAYVPASERPNHRSYEVSKERTFQSMPSGHSASAWTGAAMGLTEHLLRRPTASGIERAGIGFLGGSLAGATSALRVQAGQHFPSDVIVGAGLGIVIGVAVPLIHRGEQRLPSSNAWLQMTAGVLAGTLFGVMMAQGY